MDETREQYIEGALRAIYERHEIELKRARRFFGKEWDEEYSDDN